MVTSGGSGKRCRAGDDADLSYVFAAAREIAESLIKPVRHCHAALHQIGLSEKPDMG